MNKPEVTSLIKALQDGEVTVTFKKINSDEIRVMPCTLNTNILNENNITTEVSSVDADSANLAVWSIDKAAWRSFRLNTVTGWEITNA